MSIAETILEQLGGGRFTVMTGSRHYVSDGNSLRMHLSKNNSGANRLIVTCHPGSDLYSMRFLKETPDRLNRKSMTWTEGITIVVEVAEGLFWEDLQHMFTHVTGVDTHL